MHSPVAPMKPLLPPGFIAKPTHLIVPRDATVEAIAEACKTISGLANFSCECLPYWIGDLINACENMFRNKYEQFLELTNYALSTLRNTAWMCSRVPPENRGICSPKHSYVVAVIKDHKKQRELLERACEEGLTAAEFRRLVAGDSAYRRRALPNRLRPTVVSSWNQFWHEYGAQLSVMPIERACRKTWQTAILSCRSEAIKADEIANAQEEDDERDASSVRTGHDNAAQCGEVEGHSVGPGQGLGMDAE